MATARHTRAISARTGGLSSSSSSSRRQIDTRSRRGAPRRSRSQAFTLAESLIASVVLALAVVGVSGAMLATHQQTSLVERDSIAVSLARALMEEIAARPLVLTDGTTGLAGWPTVTDRSLYDTVGDFAEYNDVTSSAVERTPSPAAFAVSNTAAPLSTAIPPSSSVGALTGKQYARSVSISYPTSAYGVSITSGDVAIVTVTVRSAAGNSVTIVRMLSRFAQSR